MLDLDTHMASLSMTDGSPFFRVPSNHTLKTLKDQSQCYYSHDQEIMDIFQSNETVWSLVSPHKHSNHRKFDRRKSLSPLLVCFEKSGSSPNKYTSLKISPKSKTFSKRKESSKFYRSRSDSCLLRYQISKLLSPKKIAVTLSPLKKSPHHKTSPRKSDLSNNHNERTPANVRKQLFTPDSGYQSDHSSVISTPCSSTPHLQRIHYDPSFRSTPVIPKFENLDEQFQKFKKPFLPRRTRSIHLIGRYCKIQGGKLDIISHLSQAFPGVVRKILGYLQPKDLTRFACVSTVWRRTLSSDFAAEQRREKFVKRKRFLYQTRKENLQKSSSGPRNMTPTSVPLSVTQEQAGQPGQAKGNPFKTKYELFLEEGKKLKNGEKQTKCKCGSPARVNQRRAICTVCRFDFCVHCLCQSHGSTPCRASQRTTILNEPGIGTRKSRRNLRRL